MHKGPPSPLVLLGTILLGVVEAAEASGNALPKALDRGLRRPSDERDEDGDLLLTPPDASEMAFLGQHRSHRSHSSHASSSTGRSHFSGSYPPPRRDRWSNSSWTPAPDEPPPAPRPPRPAHVSLVAYPGGQIFLDGRPVGHDSTRTLTLQPGTHQVRVENAYVGTSTTTITILEGQTGVVTIAW